MRESSQASRRTRRLPLYQQSAYLLAIGCTLIAAPVVGAQTCVGLPGPEGGRVRLGAAYASAPGTDQTTVSVGGVGSSLFGGVATTTTNYDGTFGYAWQGSATLGYRVPTATGSRLELCPIVSGALGGIFSDPYNRPQNEPRRRVERLASTRLARAGLVAGYRVPVSRAFTVIPSLSANVLHASLRRDDIEFSDSNTYGLIGLSVGVVMGSRFTASPYLWVPVGLDNGTRSVGLAFTLSLWKKGSAL